MAEPDHLLSIPGFSDPFSSLTHLAGAVVFAVLSVPLLAGIAFHWSFILAIAAEARAEGLDPKVPVLDVLARR